MLVVFALLLKSILNQGSAARTEHRAGLAFGCQLLLSRLHCGRTCWMSCFAMPTEKCSNAYQALQAGARVGQSQQGMVHMSTTLSPGWRSALPAV